MSGGSVCKCEESKKPVTSRNWQVIQRNCNHSTFNGSHWTYSDYSEIHCQSCGSLWRTKAAYVNDLKDGKL